MRAESRKQSNLHELMYSLIHTCIIILTLTAYGLWFGIMGLMITMAPSTFTIPETFISRFEIRVRNIKRKSNWSKV